MTKKHMVALSYGGGVQTVALAVMAAQERIARPDLIVFADTGSEHRPTYEYNAMMNEWLAGYGLRLTVAQSNTGPLLHTLQRRKVVIPMYGDRKGATPRACTERWKIRVVRKVLRQHGATSAEVMIGFSLDEVHRVRDSDRKWVQNVYPLVAARLRREDCVRAIRDAGLPEPPPSCCTFCPKRPKGGKRGWVALKREDPAAFQQAIAIEAMFPGLYLTDERRPLAEVVSDYEQLPTLFDEELGADGCTNGPCFM